MNVDSQSDILSALLVMAGLVCMLSTKGILFKTKKKKQSQFLL